MQCFPRNTDSEGKALLDNIAKRARAYNLKE